MRAEGRTRQSENHEPNQLIPRAGLWKEEMSTSLSLSELIEYTDWKRGKWHEWLRQRGDGVLATSAGPHGDGRFQTVGDLVRHIFSAKKALY